MFYIMLFKLLTGRKLPKFDFRTCKNRRRHNATAAFVYLNLLFYQAADS